MSQTISILALIPEVYTHVEETNNEQDGFELETPAVAVAPASPNMNGNGTHSPQNSANVSTRTIVEKFAPESRVQSLTAPNQLMGRINNRSPYAPEKVKEKDDRDFLDTFNLKAEAGEYQLSCTRYQPSVNADGEPVPTGHSSKTVIPVMSYDDLYQAIVQAWGGGAYRVVFVEENGVRRADDIQRCILINIPTTQYPPKRVKDERLEPIRLNGVVTEFQSDDEKEYKKLVEQARRDAALDQLESQKADREMKKLEREIRTAQARKKLLGSDDEKPAAVALLEKRLDEEKHAREESARKAEETARKADDERKERDRKYEDDRKESLRRYEDDKKDAALRADNDRRMFMEGLTKVTEKLTEVANRPPPPQDNTMEKVLAVMAPIVTAIISKPVPLPPDNKEIFVEMNKAQAESTRQITTMTTAMLSAPKSDQNAPIMALIMKMMEKDATGKDALLGNLLTAIVSNKGDTLTPEVMMSLISMGEKRADKIIEMTQGGGQNNEADDYDPALGMLGNAGKAIFSGLKSLLESAGQNPQIIGLITNLIGTRTPTNEQLAQAAYRMEHGGVPPALIQQQQYVQSEYAPINQQQVPYPQQPAYATQKPMPPPLQSSQQQVVASELENGASGIPGIPGNGDPEDQRPRTPEELAEENLCDAITRTVEIMIGEAQGKPAKRSWPEDATDHWNKDFIKSLIDCTQNRERLKMIGDRCEKTVAQKMSQLWQADPTEQNMFWQEFTRFIAMNKPVHVIAPIVTPIVTNPAPATVQPVQSNPIQG